MFDVPQAKRVRREELYSPAHSPSASPDPELDQIFRKRLEEHYAGTAALTPTFILAVEDEGESEEVEFRLFAKPSKAEDSKINKIRVQSPTFDDGPAGLVNPERPREHYFRDSLSPEAEKRLKLAAVSGEEVFARSRTVWSGCLLPWRIITILSTGKPVPTTSSHTVDQKDVLRKKKRRKGKKTRITIRKKATADRERLEKEQKSAADKELEERIKRAKRNRDKRLKKREREKAKRAASKGTEGGVATSSDEKSNKIIANDPRDLSLP